MKTFTLLLALLLSGPALACLHLKGTVRVNGDEIRIDQHIVRGKVYSFPKDKLIVNLTYPKSREDLLKYEIIRKTGRNLEPLSAGDLLLKKDQEVTVSTKDLRTQSESTISLKLTEI